MQSPRSVNRRFSLYILANVAFALLVGVACAVGGFPNPRVLHLLLLFALCSTIIIDIDGLNGRYALQALFMAVYFVSYGVGDLSNLLGGTDISTMTSSEHAQGLLSKTEAVILLGGIMWVLGYRIAVLIASANRPISNTRDWSKSAILTIGVVFWAIGTIATYRWYVYIVPDTTNEAFRKGLASISSATASAYILGEMCQPLGILLLAYAYRVFRTPYLAAIIIAITVIQLFVGFVADIKGLAMLAGVLVIITSVLIDNRMPKAWLAAGAAFVIFVFPVYQAYRTAIHGNGIARTTVVENFGKILQLTLAAKDRVNSGRDRAQTFLERSSVKGSTEIIVEKTGNGVDFQRGYTLSPILATFVPRIIWSDKHEVQTGQMVNKLFHITDSDDIFISPSHLGELYWNFGWTGALLGMGLIGLICGWIGTRFNLADSVTVTRVLVTVVTIKFLIVGFEGAIHPVYVTWARLLAGIGILHLVFARVQVSSRLLAPANSGLEALSVDQPREKLFPNLLT